MGLTRVGVAFVAAMRRAGVDFDRTLTIGRQTLFADDQRVAAAFAEAGLNISSVDATELVERAQGFAEPLFEHLGARHVESVDISDYQGATLIHDLNEPLPDDHRAAYTAVVDGGTLEHVFDFPAALKTALEAVSVGGHYIAISPVSGHAGHGFYQFSPELYYRVLTARNGFRMACVLWQAELPLARWYAVADPESVRRRVRRHSRMPALLFVAAERVENVPILQVAPQQSDYVTEWAAGRRPSAPPAKPKLPGWLANNTPLWVKDMRIFLEQTWRDRPVAADFKAVRLATVQFPTTSPRT